MLRLGCWRRLCLLRRTLVLQLYSGALLFGDALGLHDDVRVGLLIPRLHAVLTLHSLRLALRNAINRHLTREVSGEVRGHATESIHASCALERHPRPGLRHAELVWHVGARHPGHAVPSSLLGTLVLGHLTSTCGGSGRVGRHRGLRLPCLKGSLLFMR